MRGAVGVVGGAVWRGEGNVGVVRQREGVVRGVGGAVGRGEVIEGGVGRGVGVVGVVGQGVGVVGQGVGVVGGVAGAVGGLEGRRAPARRGLKGGAWLELEVGLEQGCSRGARQG